MKMPRSRLLALTTLAMLSTLPLAGCDHSPRTLSIGVLVAQTGNSGARGKDLLNGATLAAEEINRSAFTIDGKPLHVQIMATDDKGEVEAAIAQAHDLLDTGIDAMIGPVNSNQAAAVIPVVATKGLPQLITATSASLLALGHGNVLRLLANDDQQGRAIGAFAADNLHARRIGIVVEKSDYGRGLNSSVVDSLGAHGIAAKVTVEIDDKDADHGRDGFALAGGRARHHRVPRSRTAARRPDGRTGQGRLERHHRGRHQRRPQQERRHTAHWPSPRCTPPPRPSTPRSSRRATNSWRTSRSASVATPCGVRKYAYDAVYALADAAHQGRSLAPADLVQTLKRIEPGTKVNQQMRFAANGEQVYPAIGVYKVERGAWAMQMMSATW